jgi:hypothetical protein
MAMPGGPGSRASVPPCLHLFKTQWLWFAAHPPIKDHLCSSKEKDVRIMVNVFQKGIKLKWKMKISPTPPRDSSC